MDLEQKCSTMAKEIIYQMKETKELLSMLLLSCDNYSDLWDDFFNLKEKFWPECPYQWYVVTESKDCERENVRAIKCGKELNWSGRFRKAVQTVATPFIGIYLEDYFINSPIDSERIEQLVILMNEKRVDFLDLGNVFKHKINQPNKQYFADHLMIIDKHLRYGLDTAAAIWKKEYLLEKLGEGDYSAWRFEADRCAEAATEEGYNGLILVDDRISFNVSEIPVVVQGMFYPPVIEDFRKRGYEIDTSKRKIMSGTQKFKYDFKRWCVRIPFGHKFMKWFGTKFLGYKFFTED